MPTPFGYSLNNSTPFPAVPSSTQAEADALAISGGEDTFCDIALSPVDGDWWILDGDTVFTYGIEGVKSCAECELQLVLGEWWEDPSDGIDYENEIFAHGPNAALIVSIFRNRLQTKVIGIKSVTDCSLSYDPAARTGSLTWSASTDFGKINKHTTEVRL